MQRGEESLVLRGGGQPELPLGLTEPISKPGDYVALRAEEDLLIAISVLQSLQADAPGGDRRSYGVTRGRVW